MTLSLESAIAFLNARELELTQAGWNKTPAEEAAQRVVADYAWLWRRFELAWPEEAAAFRAGIEVAIELRGKG